MKEHGIKIRLTVDLTKYHSKLVKGTEGITLPKDYRKMDDMTDCRFFDCYDIRVAPSGYEIIDEEYLAEVAEGKAQTIKDCLSAISILKTETKRGRHIEFRVNFINSAGEQDYHIIRKHVVPEIEKMLREAGKKIEVRIVD